MTPNSDWPRQWRTGWPPSRDLPLTTQRDKPAGAAGRKVGDAGVRSRHHRRALHQGGCCRDLDVRRFDGTQRYYCLSHEADGTSHWFPRLFSSDGDVTQLAYGEDGTVAETTEGEVQPRGWPSRCTICTKTCEYIVNGTVVGGCTVSCAAVCGPVALACTGVCGYICSTGFMDAFAGDCRDACESVDIC